MASNIPDNQPDEMFGIGVASVSLNVGIVGAGIAGLTAATALRQSGHHVEVRPPSGDAYWSLLTSWNLN